MFIPSSAIITPSMYAWAFSSFGSMKCTVCLVAIWKNHFGSACLFYLNHAGFGHEVYADAAYGFYFHHNAFVAVDSFYDSFHVFEGTGGYFYFAVYFSYEFFGFQISKFFFWTTGNLDEVIHLSVGHGDYFPT